MRSTILFAAVCLAVAPAAKPVGDPGSPDIPSSTTSEDCPGPCTVDGPSFSWIVWQSAVPTHIVAATLVYIIDNGTNTTSTSTISLDTTALLDSGHIYPPQPTNANGTVVTTITFSGTETVVAYPTQVQDYGSSYTVWGQYESTGIDNALSCVSETAIGAEAPKTALPSHPPLSTIPPQIPSDGDAVGNNFVPKWEYINFEPVVEQMFPDIGAFHSCEAHPIAPAVILSVASFLTDTSTSYISSSPTSQADPAGPPAQPSQSPTALPQSTSNPPAGPPPASPADSPLNSPPVPVQTAGSGGTPPVLTVGGQTLTANQAGGLAVGGQTVVPGGPAITVSGTPISLAPGATAVVVGSSTVPIIGNSGAPTVLTVGGQTITANPAGTFVVGGQTLVPGGPAITISGTKVSLAPGATDIVVGTSTMPIATLGGYTGPLANGAGRMDRTWRGLLMGACLATWWGFCWIVY